MLTLQEIKVLVNDFYQNINNSQYIQNVLDNHPTTFTKTVWSKDMAYSLMPLGLEVLGFKGSKYLTKKPNTIKYLYEYKLIDDMIREVIVHDVYGNHINTDYLYRNGDYVFELTLDLDNKAESLTCVLYKNDRVFSSFRVDSDQDFWYNEYIYVDGRIKQILSRQSNSDEGNYVGSLDVDYIDNLVVNIYHYHKGTKYNHYIYKG